LNQIPRPQFKRKRLAVALAALAVLGANQSEASLDNRLNLQGLVIDSEAGAVARSQLKLHGLVIDSEVGVVNREQLILKGLVIDSVTGVVSGERLNLQGLVIDSDTGIASRERLSLDGFVINNESIDGSSQRLDLQGLVINTETSVSDHQQINLQGLVIDSQSGIEARETSESLAETGTEKVEIVFLPLSLTRKNTLVALLTKNGHSAFDFGRGEFVSHSELTNRQQQSLTQETEAPFPEVDSREEQPVILSSIKSDAGREITEEEPTKVFAEDDLVIVSKEALSERSRKSLSIFEPSIASFVQYDDNLFLDSAEEQSEVLAVIQPTIRYRYDRRKSQLDVNYALAKGKYFDYGRADYTDHDLNSGWELKVGRRNLMKLVGRYRRSHERRSFTSPDDSRAALVGNPTEYEDLQLGVGYVHGNWLDRTRFEVRGATHRIRLEDGEHNRSQDDRDLQQLTFGYFWHFKRRFSIFTEGRYKTVDYKEVSRDSDQLRLVAGSEVRFRKRLAGTIRFGFEDKKFNDLEGYHDYDDTVWDVSLDWQPAQNTTLKLESAKALAEVEEIGDTNSGVFVVKKHLGVDWKQAWTSKFTTSVTLRKYDDALQGIDRNDEMTWIRFRASYNAMPKLKIGFDGVHESRKFNSAPDADRSTITLRAEYSF